MGEDESPLPADRPGSTPYSQTVEAQAQWEPTIIRFGHAFATPHGSFDVPAWRAGLKHLITPAIDQQLANTDPAEIPTGTYEGWHVLDYGETQLTAEITYTDGTPVSIKLITDGQHWIISSIEPA